MSSYFTLSESDKTISSYWTLTDKTINTYWTLINQSKSIVHIEFAEPDKTIRSSSTLFCFHSYCSWIYASASILNDHGSHALPNNDLLSSQISQLWPFKLFLLSGSRTVVPFYLRIIVYVPREPPHFSLCFINYKSRGRIDSQFLLKKELLFPSKLFPIQKKSKASSF